MSNAQVISVLNELLVIHHRSAVMYFQVAHPWTRNGDDKAQQVIHDVIADHEALSARLAQEIQRRGGPIELGEFDMDYASTHDLAMNYVLGWLVTEQKKDIQRIESCVERLAEEPAARALAEEALGAARGHLQSLEEAAVELAGSA